MYEVKEPFWQFIDHWQTLIAGLLALLAGVGTVLGTLAAAKSQVRAANAAADRAVAAAQEQTKAAQRQTETALETERRRISREGYAFHAVLEAAMMAVIEDVEAAQELLQASPPSGNLPYTATAYEARQRVKRAGFAELRTAFIRSGGTLTDNFLRLDKEIEALTAASTTQRGTNQYLGLVAGLQEQLNLIEHLARLLQSEANNRMEITRAAAGTDVA